MDERITVSVINRTGHKIEITSDRMGLIIMANWIMDAARSYENDLLYSLADEAREVWRDISREIPEEEYE